MLKNMRRVILFDIFLNPSFKMTTRFANIARTTAGIFINLPKLPDKLISHLLSVIECQLLKSYQTLFERRLFSMLFNKPIL